MGDHSVIVIEDSPVKPKRKRFGHPSIVFSSSDEESSPPSKVQIKMSVGRRAAPARKAKRTLQGVSKKKAIAPVAKTMMNLCQSVAKRAEILLAMKEEKDEASSQVVVKSEVTEDQQAGTSSGNGCGDYYYDTDLPLTQKIPLSEPNQSKVRIATNESSKPSDESQVAKRKSPAKSARSKAATPSGRTLAARSAKASASPDKLISSTAMTAPPATKTVASAIKAVFDDVKVVPTASKSGSAATKFVAPSTRPFSPPTKTVSSNTKATTSPGSSLNLKRSVLSTQSESPSKKRIKLEPGVGSSSTTSVNQKPSTRRKSLKQLDSEIIDVDLVAGRLSCLMQDGLWDIFEVISKRVNKNYTITKTIVNLLEKGCTLPFLCRYRREQSGGMSIEDLHNIKEEYTKLVEVRRKAENLIEKYEKEGKLSENIREAIFAARSVDELEMATESLKTSGARTHAGKARSLGYQEMATAFRTGAKSVPQLTLAKSIDRNVEGKRTVEEVLLNLQYILADDLRKDRVILDKIDEIAKNPNIIIISKKKRATAKKKLMANSKDTEDKFQNYFDFKHPIGQIPSHMVLAINRGESLGFLSVSVDIPIRLEEEIKSHCRMQLMKPNLGDAASRELIENTVQDCTIRLIRPHIHRMVRASLNRRAEKDAMKCFSDNLRSLLMTPPVRGQPVLGIDPGFKNGCKLAMISSSGQLLEHNVIYPHCGKMHHAKFLLAKMLKQHNCEIIAIGDGTACRETQAMVSDCIREKVFSPLNVKFCTVREAGVSVYSVTAEAEAELPGLDSFVKSAVSIARRLQDPLVEYVKVEPKHLGIGMYQHDINESNLKEALQSTVVECVSFVGVDINVCAEFLLRQVAGLNATAARNIIKYRDENGPFRNREQLRLVPQIGPLRFEQCAGFVKIYPETAQFCADTPRKRPPPTKTNLSSSFEPLDTTIVHPESYAVTRKVIKDIGVDIKDLGTDNFINKVKHFSATTGSAGVANKYKISVMTAELILKALSQRRDWDMRDENSQPIFLENMKNAADVKIGDVLTGVVTNVVAFGAFIDCGIGMDLLLHNSKMQAVRATIKLGDRLEVVVYQIDSQRNRFGVVFQRFL